MRQSISIAVEGETTEAANKAFCLVAAFVFPFCIILDHLRHSARKRKARSRATASRFTRWLVKAIIGLMSLILGHVNRRNEYEHHKIKMSSLQSSA